MPPGRVTRCVRGWLENRFQNFEILVPERYRGNPQSVPNLGRLFPFFWFPCSFFLVSDAHLAIPTAEGEGANLHTLQRSFTPIPSAAWQYAAAPSSVLPAARCPLCAPPHMRAASSSVRALPGALMPARCSLCRRVGGACARVRLTLGPLPLSRAGLPCLRTARCPCTSGARARSPSAFHSVRTVRSSRPLPLHTAHVCFVCAVDRT